MMGNMLRLCPGSGPVADLYDERLRSKGGRDDNREIAFPLMAPCAECGRAVRARRLGRGAVLHDHTPLGVRSDER